MNKVIRNNKYIAPKITGIDMESTTILAGSGDPKSDTGWKKVDFNNSPNGKGTWNGAKAQMRQDIGDWSEEE